MTLNRLCMIITAKLTSLHCYLMTVIILSIFEVTSTFNSGVQWKHKQLLEKAVAQAVSGSRSRNCTLNVHICVRSSSWRFSLFCSSSWQMSAPTTKPENAGCQSLVHIDKWLVDNWITVWWHPKGTQCLHLNMTFGGYFWTEVMWD